ncbi:MAG: reverse transcriptase domain-containing protein [Rikenellaceae bacterium]
MKGRMQKILSKDNSYPQKSSTECDGYEGAQTFIGISENNLVEVIPTEERLMEEIFSSHNLNQAYQQVVGNKGAGGVDKMGVEELRDYLREHKEALLTSLMSGQYKPTPVRRVEIPKGNGKLRPLGIPTVVDRLISLIHKYLNAGVIVSGKFETTTDGVPQGGNLSPILSNIMLNELDKELAKRGHKFVRYADDCMILCKSKRSAQRMQESITNFIEQKLSLRVNREKTRVGYVRGMKFLGYSFYVSKGKCRLSLHMSSLEKMKSRLKEITSRSNGMGYERRKWNLRVYIQGWITYYHLADMKYHLKRVDEWLRRRIRMCIWKCWKRPKTKFKNLLRCGINKQKSLEWANTRKCYWRIAKSPILKRAITNESLCQAGYTSLSGCYSRYYRN